MLDVLLFFLVMVAAGWGLRRLGLMRPESAKDLNNLVFHVTLPPMIFLAIHEASLSPSMAVLPAFGWGMSILSVAAGFAIARAMRLTGPEAGAVVVAVGFANTTFLGYPIIQAFYGAHHLTLAILYDMLGTTLAVNTLGVAIAAGAGGGTASLGAVARRLVAMPTLWGLAAGLALHGVPLPAGLATLLRSLGGLTTPLIMLSLGLTLEFAHWRRHLGPVAAVAVTRLALLPALAWGLARLFGVDTASSQAIALQAAMPTMFYSLTLAVVFGLETTLVVNAIMVTTVLSFATLPLWHALLR